MDNKETIDSNTIEENFVKWSIPRPTQDYMVVVHCSTYNHGKYIEDALKGFVMQKTDFPFCAIVIDDGSTDDAPNIIRRYAESYPEIIKPILLGENHMQHGKSRNPYFDDWHNAAKYIAFCEGDDYWTDPLKLQKQVDFLEGHEEYSMCFHKVNVESTVLEEKLIFDHLEERDYSQRQIFDNWTVPTCSVVYRNGLPFERHPSIVYGDIFMFLQLAERGRLHCLGFVGGVYRRHEGGASCGYFIQREVRLFHQYKYMQKRFPELSDISIRKQERELEAIIYAPYFPGLWKYRFRYMFRHPRVLFTSFLTTTILSCTPIRNYKIWRKRCR